jgi:hypothetical protein
VAAVVVASGCGDKKKWAEAQQRAAQEQRAAEAKRKDEAIEKVTEAPKEAVAAQDPYWDNPSFIRVVSDKKCPDGLWSIFPGPAPSAEGDAKTNEATRGEKAKSMQGSTFTVHLTSADIALGEYDPGKGEIPVEIKGVIDCVDSIGRVGIAFGPPKAVNPPNSAAKEEAEVQMNIWTAPPLRFAVKQSMGAAKEFAAKHRFDLDARIVFRLGKTQVDKKMVKISDVSQKEDWGAGRVVTAIVENIRVGYDHGKSVIHDSRQSK